MPPKKPKNPWEKSQANKRQYEASLRKIGREVGRIIEGHSIKTPEDARRAQESLQKYAELIAPWAQKTAGEMLAHADLQDVRAWKSASKEIGVNLREEITSAPTGAVYQQLLAENVILITSLPIEAGQRVHKLATEAMINSTRADEIAEEIERSGEVTQSRAMLIARTETSRASTILTHARAQSVGSESYIWRTSRDSDVRPSHRKLEGKTFRWDNPPECDPGHHANPGCIWNCRCWPEVILPRKIY